MDRRSIELVLAVTASVLLPGCSPENSPQPPSVQGTEVFAANCSPCHGEGGRGPSLDSIRSLSPEARRNAIRNHPTAGQIPQRLPTAEIGALLEFFDNPPPGE